MDATPAHFLHLIILVSIMSCQENRKRIAVTLSWLVDNLYRPPQPTRRRWSHLPHLLYAASIVRSGDAIYVRVGDHDLTSKQGSPGAQTLRVSTTYIHHNHNTQTLDNDIALLKLHGEVSLVPVANFPFVCPGGRTITRVPYLVGKTLCIHSVTSTIIWFWWFW